MNRYALGLLIGGGSAIALGGIIAFIAGQNAQNSADVDALTGAMLGTDYGTSAATAAATGWMWFGIVLAILGAVALIAGIAVNAVTTERLPAASR